jgi:branched-chain amino acid transport system permease protein
MDYSLHLMIMICIYTLLAQSLNLSAGYTGLISLAQAGFYGIGAYTTAILSTEFHLSFWINLPLAMLFCGVIAFLLSYVALRTAEDYFVMCTLGIQVIIYALLNNLVRLTNGPLGISNIPPIGLGHLLLTGKTAFLLLSLAFTGAVWWILHNIARSGFGYILRAISEDEIFTMSIGKDVRTAKMLSFVTTSVLATIPGALYAHYISYIDPTSFTVSESTFILSIVIIGSLRSFTGSFLAAVFLVLLPETLRFTGIPYNLAGNLRQMIYGLILIAIMMTGKNGFKGLLSLSKNKGI